MYFVFITSSPFNRSGTKTSTSPPISVDLLLFFFFFYYLSFAEKRCREKDQGFDGEHVEGDQGWGFCSRHGPKIHRRWRGRGRVRRGSRHGGSTRHALDDLGRQVRNVEEWIDGVPFFATLIFLNSTSTSILKKEKKEILNFISWHMFFPSFFLSDHIPRSKIKI